MCDLLWIFFFLKKKVFQNTCDGEIKKKKRKVYAAICWKYLIACESYASW